MHTNAFDRISRRGLLQGSAALAGAVGLGVASASRAGAEVPGGSPGFAHGVASGDPLPDAVIIWTRITPTAEATPGSGVGPAVTLNWQVATDEGFASVVASGSVAASADSDHTA
ncbi:PhoD-like phosphatase N-terminal domain-containing protein, partial [Streptomyces sp. NPDC050698]